MNPYSRRMRLRDTQELMSVKRKMLLNMASSDWPMIQEETGPIKPGETKQQRSKIPGGGDGGVQGFGNLRSSMMHMHHHPPYLPQSAWVCFIGKQGCRVGR